MAHAIQLFDSDDSLSVEVATFLHRGYLLGERLRVIATPDHMAGIARHLGHLGCPVDEVIASRRLVWKDAASRLRSLESAGRICGQRVQAGVRDLVYGEGDLPVPTRIYGEMVDLLAARADLKRALDLEETWTHAVAGLPVSLLCGYASGRFGDPSTAQALQAICHQHDEIRTCPNDLLGAWLVGRAGN